MKRDIALLLLLLLTLPPCVSAQTWGPWEVPQASHQRGRLDNSNGELGTAIRLFQRYISPIDGARCNMYPTCSAYALQALRSYGPVLGSFIFVDRLYHEGDPIEQQHQIIKYGYYRFYDPLINNTFWLADQFQPASGTQ